MDKNLPTPDFEDIVFELQFDGENFSSKLNESQPFWPLHNYTKEVRILNRIHISIGDKEFLDNIKSGKIAPKKHDIVKAKLQLDGENYKIVKILELVQSTKFEFKKL